MIPFPQLEKHQLVCLSRKVLCPGSKCKLQIQFNKMKEHANSCPHIFKIVNGDNYTWSQVLPRNKKDTNDKKTWPTKPLMAHGRLFFLKKKRENRIHTFETIMLGTEEECKDYLSTITIFDKDSKIFTKIFCHPRPISLENWWDMGLMMSEKALAKIWTLGEDGYGYGYEIKLSIDKV